jgi:hypothetical protein
MLLLANLSSNRRWVPVPELQMLAHASIATTQRYMNARPKLACGIDAAGARQARRRPGDEQVQAG